MTVWEQENFHSESPSHYALETSGLVPIYTLRSEGYKFQGTANIGGVLFS
jgi:hypothetical protein